MEIVDENNMLLKWKVWGRSMVHHGSTALLASSPIWLAVVAVWLVVVWLVAVWLVVVWLVFVCMITVQVEDEGFASVSIWGCSPQVSSNCENNKKNII